MYRLRKYFRLCKSGVHVNIIWISGASRTVSFVTTFITTFIGQKAKSRSIYGNLHRSYQLYRNNGIPKYG
ncbi:hypothetical protein RCL_jg17313.t1 [Rhizophagus clarus]|uniref:Uncharacterized protein n=1 Tax=Rhizophagus clarus TaxID=94130 RepID=A0A8H3QEU9_9GLOM|nr:hypothetical protein RCL_jg17313.t1 [Rhizophagus clarus]